MNSRSLLALIAVAVIELSCEHAPTLPATPREVSLSINANLSGTAITAVVVKVTGPGIPDTLLFNLAVSNGQASGTIQVPTGSTRVLTVHGFDANGIETHRGSATIDVQIGSNPTVTVTLLPLVGNQPIVVTVGTILVTVSPGTATLNAGDTLRFRAVVTDSVGDTLNVRVTWASTNPNLVSVDTVGLALAKASGSAELVAVYGAAAGAAVVVVPTSWVLKTGLPGENLTSVWASSSSDVYVSGGFRSVDHFNGNSWGAVPVPGGEANRYQVFGFSSTNVYTAGEWSIDHYDGSTWSTILPLSGGLQGIGIWGNSPNDLFITVDQSGGPAANSQMWHFNGTAWSNLTPTSPCAAMSGLWGTSGTNVYTTCTNGGGGGWILHYNGTVFDTVFISSQPLVWVHGTSASDVFAVGQNGVIVHYNGSTWTSMSSGTNADLGGVFARTPQDVFAAGTSGTVLHSDGLGWSSVPTGTMAELGGVFAPDANHVFIGVVGPGAVLVGTR